jgi:hypothetical protein
MQPRFYLVAIDVTVLPSRAATDQRNRGERDELITLVLAHRSRLSISSHVLPATTAARLKRAAWSSPG